MAEINGVPFLRWRYYSGPKGIGGWTTQPDSEGWFYAFFCKPAGKGARQGDPERYEYVKRLTTKRRRRKACEDRAQQMAYGLKRQVKEKKVEDTGPGIGFCMHCKERVQMRDPYTATAKNGRQVIRGTCPHCSTAIQKFGKVTECPECGGVKEMAATDYICKECRAKE